MKKKGISLIVLVITIIVMIILAAAVVISMSNTGIIDRADVATQTTNEKQVQQLAAVVWADAYADMFKAEELKVEVINRLKNQGINVNDYAINVTDKGIDVIPNANKVTTLAGTAWKFNEYISGYVDVFEVFNFEEQTGWEEFPDGCVIMNPETSYEIGGFTLTTEQDITAFGTVQGWDMEYTLMYIPKNNLNFQNGWITVSMETTEDYLLGKINDLQELFKGCKLTSAPTVVFTTETNSALMNAKLINWLYENATRIK